MNAPLPVFPPELEPGAIIELGSINELPKLEDTIAPFVEPLYNPSLWATRPPVDELLRPRVNGRLFYGRLGNITLTVMADPYEKLITSKERGRKFVSSINPASFKRTSIDAEESIAHYFGVEFSAEVFTTGKRDPIGSTAAELWYYPVPRDITKAGKVDKSTYTTKDEEVRSSTYIHRQDLISSRHTGEAIRRIVTKPEYQADMFIEYDKLSRRIGFEVLRNSLRHPFRG